MYIRDCGYGRSKSCRSKIPFFSVGLLLLGLSCITIRVMAGQEIQTGEYSIKTENGMGYEVLMTRTVDSLLSLEERVKLANESGADIYVSIHQNACEENRVSGIATWYSAGKGEDSKSYVTDFEKAYQTVYEVTGEKVQLFRFPGGSINAYNKNVYKDIIKEMTDRGFVYYDWNASLEDAVSKSNPEKLLQNARETTLERKRVVLLAHDTVDNTVLCMEELIEQFPEYRMEPLTPEVEPIQF